MIQIFEILENNYYTREELKSIFEQLKIIKEKIDKNLVRFFNDNSVFLYRGYSSGRSKIFCSFPRTNRQPTDSPFSLQFFIDNILEKKNIKALRRNSFFTTINYKVAEKYGIPYVVFPVGNFSFYCNLKLDDVYENFMEDDLYLKNLVDKLSFKNFMSLKYNYMDERRMQYHCREFLDFIRHLIIKKVKENEETNEETEIKTLSKKLGYEFYVIMTKEFLWSVFRVPDIILSKVESYDDKDLFNYISYKMITMKPENIKFTYRDTYYGKIFKNLFKKDSDTELKKIQKTFESFSSIFRNMSKNSLFDLLTDDPMNMKKSNKDYERLYSLYNNIFLKNKKLTSYIEDLLTGEKNAVYGNYPEDEQKFKYVLKYLNNMKKGNEILINGECCYIHSEIIKEKDNYKKEIINFLLK
jgi:hypothetical protein